MPRATFLQTNFNAGEWSPLAYGRADLKKYGSALETCLNYVPTTQGSLTRRPGMKYIAPTKSNAASVRLIPYEYSITQAYVLEFGDKYIRFYTNGGQLLNNSATAYRTSAVTFDNVTDRITWTGHGLAVDDPVVFFPNSGATMPAGVTAGSVYYVVTVVDANTIQVSSTFEGTALNFTTNGTGTFYANYVYSNGQLTTYSGNTYVCISPTIYAPTVTPTVTFAASSTITVTNHGLYSGMAVSFTAGTGGALPAAITAGTTYYVIRALTADTFTIAATVNGREITMATAGTVGSTPNTCTLSPNFWYQQPSTAYELPTTYASGDLFQIAYVQSADVLYLAHNGYPPKKLSRLGSQKWSFETITIDDGPYLAQNKTTTTLTAAAATGATTLTASSTAGINNGFGFLSSDVGRHVRLYYKGTAPVVAWGWGKITAVNSRTVANFTWTTAPSGAGVAATSAVSTWRLGAYSPALGYPGAICFHQDRLVLGGTTTYPNRIDFTITGDYEDFRPTNYDGTVVDSNAISFTINSAKMNVINWLVSDEWGLLVGSASSEWVVAPSTTGIALTPTNINVKQTSTYGGADIYPVRIGKTTFFMQRTQRKLRAMAYKFIANSFEAPDVSMLSEHLTQGGIKQMAVANAPFPIIWMVRNDGKLVGVTYDTDQEILGWHQHQVGGYSDAAKSAYALIESVACIPSQTTTYDEIWVSVKRYINGAVVRTVELMSKYWENGDQIQNSFFVDCGASVTLPTGTYSRSSTTLTATFTTAHGLTTGNTKYFKFDDVSLNGLYTVTVTSTTQLTITTATSSSATGTIGLYANTISGATWLAGETVGVLVDGATHPDVVVSGAGGITLNSYYNTIVFGYKYNSDGKTLRIEAGGGDGPAQGKLKRIHRIMVRYFQSVGTQVQATGINNIYNEPFRSSADPMTGPVGLFTGDKRFSWEGTYELEGQVFWRQSDPLPSNILMIGAQLDTQDGG